MLSGKVRSESIVYIGWIAIVLGPVFDAYSLAGVPVEWIVGSAATVAAGMLVMAYGCQRYYSVLLIVLFLAWAVLVTAGNVIARDFSMLMPRRATTTYGVFVSLRIFRIVIFIAVVYVTLWLLARGYGSLMRTAVVLIGIGVGVIALYLYFAHLYGWPELPRTRIGTTGREQKTLFAYYGIQRATGTFREPSFLGTWLLLPFFLCFTAGKQLRVLAAAFLGGIIALTGSLTAFIALIGGAIAGLIVSAGMGLRRIGVALTGIVLFVGGVLVVNEVGVSLRGQDTVLTEVIEERIEPVLKGGSLLATNRGRTFRYIEAVGVWDPVGDGLGNANLVLAERYNRPTVASYYSLYINMLYSTGMIGLLLLCWGLFVPLKSTVKLRHLWSDGRMTQALVACYIAFLLAFAGLHQELTVTFGIIYAMLVHECRRMVLQH